MSPKLLEFAAILKEAGKQTVAGVIAKAAVNARLLQDSARKELQEASGVRWVGVNQYPPIAEAGEVLATDQINTCTAVALKLGSHHALVHSNGMEEVKKVLREAIKQLIKKYPDDLSKIPLEVAFGSRQFDVKSGHYWNVMAQQNLITTKKYTESICEEIGVKIDIKQDKSIGADKVYFDGTNPLVEPGFVKSGFRVVAAINMALNKEANDKGGITK